MGLAGKNSFPPRVPPTSEPVAWEGLEGCLSPGCHIWLMAQDRTRLVQLFIISAKEGLTGRKKKHLFIHLHQNALQLFTPALPLLAWELCYHLSINLAAVFAYAHVGAIPFPGCHDIQRGEQEEHATGVRGEPPHIYPDDPFRCGCSLGEGGALSAGHRQEARHCPQHPDGHHPVLMTAWEVSVCWSQWPRLRSRLQSCITSHWSEWPTSKSLQIINGGESVEKKEPSCLVNEKVNQCSHYGRQYGASSDKTKNRTTIWPNSTTPGRTSGEKSNSKRHIHLSAHCSIIYNSQEWKQPKCPSTMNG